MKKAITTFVFAIAAFSISAQTIDSIPHHNLGPYGTQANSLMETQNGNLIANIGIIAPYPTPYDTILGYVLHEVSRRELPMDISDTLFFPSEWMPWSLSARDPQGDGNILVEFYNDTNNECFLEIHHFNDDLIFDSAEIIIPIANSIRTGTHPGPQLEANGDIVLAYYDYYSSPLEVTFSRIALDGTIKFQKNINTLEIQSGHLAGPIIFSDSPRTYFCWGHYYDQLHYQSYINCYLLDSLFNVTDSFTLPNGSGSPDYVDYSRDGFLTSFLGLDDGCFLAARTYNRNSYAQPFVEDDGVAVMKYDREFNLLARRKFLSEPYNLYSGFDATPIGLEKSKDGNIYFAYFTQAQAYECQVCVVKMDSNLNIVWQRHCLDRERNRSRFGKMIVLDDNSVAVMGVRYCFENGTNDFDHSEAFFVIVHDDYDAVEEQGVIVRPYTYWPNPTHDELHLQYSPDVQPACIELYDLQGRLIQTQTHGLECLRLEGLAAGQYLMKVILEDGKAFTDKVVKE